MRFKVREGFAIHFTRLVEIPGLNGEFVQEQQTNSYYAGQLVEFDTEANALDHAHKLEPFDKQAQDWLASRAVAIAPPPVAGIDPAALAEIVAAAVAAAVAKPAATA